MRTRIVVGLLLLAAVIGGGLYFYRDELLLEIGVNPYIRDALPSGYKPQVRIEIPKMPPGDFKKVVFPANPSPFVLMKTELWDVPAQTKVATIQYDIGPAPPQALAADGKHFAFEKDGAVNVLELSSGQNVLKIPYDKNQGNLEFVEFAGAGRVVAAARAFSAPDPKKPHPSDTLALEVWDIPARKRIHSFRVPGFEQKGAVISADGKKLAAMSVNHLRIHDLETGRTLAEWQPAPGKFKSLLIATGIRFSPDGRELAALIGMSSLRMVMRWDASTAQLTGEHLFPGLTNVGHTGPALQWLPDGNGWLIDGHTLVHGSTGRIVWLLHTKAPFVNTVGILDQNHLFAPVHEDETHAMISVPIPWTEIETALKAEAAADAAPLRPKQPVSLQIDIGDLHLGNEQQARDELTKALSERLAADGIPVADQQSTLIYARFKEASGRTLKVYSMGVFNPKAGEVREAQETQMALEIGIQPKGSPDVLWKTYLTRGAGLIVSGEGTTRDVHQDTFGALLRDIRRLPWPYFIPASKETARLPIVSQL